MPFWNLQEDALKNFLNLQISFLKEELALCKVDVSSETQTKAKALFETNGITYADNNERIHFIPIWYDNGEYAVSVTASEVWTPAGMVAATRNSNAINIDGVMYDDWYQS